MTAVEEGCVAIGDAVATRQNRLEAVHGRYALDGRPTLLRAAELQYFRVPAEQWAASVVKLRDAGCNAIASYIPWSWHQPAPETLDFTGETEPHHNLIRFLELIREAGLIFIARPGPFIYAEYRGFGYPDWLAREIPEALARRANGRPATSDHFQIFSVQHPAYVSFVEQWYADVAAALRPFLNDPVVAWQLDNETGMPFTLRVGDLDFNADTVQRYRRYLSLKYEGVRLLSYSWGRRVRSFETVLPPRARTTGAELSDWQEFLETWIAGYLQRLGKAARDVGITLPLAVNEPGEYLSPQNPRLKSQGVAMYGYDSYTKVTGSAHTADFPWTSSHHPLRFQQFAGEQRPLMCWELGTGWWDWRAQVPVATTIQNLGAGVAHGLKGYNLYAAQDGRDPGGYLFQFRGLLAEDGSPTDRLEAVARFQQFVATNEAELAASEERYDPIGFLDYQPYTRLAAEDCLPLPVPGLLEPLRYFAKWGFAGFHAVLQTAGYNVPFVDLQSVSGEDLDTFAALIFPSRGYLDVDSFERLAGYVERGGNLVTFPEPATHRTDGRRLDFKRLWPFRPLLAHWRGRNELIAHLLTRWMLPYYLYTRWRTARVSPGALHLSDLIEPALVGQAAKLPVVPLDTFDGGTGARLDGEFRLLCFQEGGDILLRHRRASAAYRVPVGRGTSTLIGTVLGAAYTTSRFYAMTPEQRSALRRFALSLFEPLVPRRVVPDESLQVETVIRRAPDGGSFLFVINRLGAQHGTLRFPDPAALGAVQTPRAETLYSAFGSTAAAIAGGVALDLAADDVLVLRVR